MNVDGWITIGTRINNKKFDKQIAELERKGEKKKYEIDVQTKNIQEAKQNIKDLKKELDLYLKANEEVIAQESRYQELLLKGADARTPDEDIEFVGLEMAGINDDVSKSTEQWEEMEHNIDKATANLEKQERKLKEQIGDYNAINNKIEEIKQKESQQNLTNIRSQVEGIGNSIQKVTKKIVKWGLAIFGVRSAYLFVRQAMSTLTQYNDQLATDINYIKFAIASTLEPIIVRIVELVYKLLGIVGTLIKRLTGYNIFKNSGVDKFQKGIKDSAKSAKELKNQLADFDEMNVLQDTSETGTGSDTGGVAPSIDLSKIKNQKVPKWMETIVKVGKWIIDNWETVVGMLLLTKLFIDVITGNWIGAVIDIIGFIILGASQIWEAIQKLWEGIKEIWQLIVNWASKKGEEIAGTISKKIEDIVEKWNNFKERVQEIWQEIVDWFVEKWDAFTEWINDKITKIANFFKTLWDGVMEGVSRTISWIRDKFNSIKDFFKNIISTIIGFFKTIGTKVGEVIGGAFKSVINGVLKAIENILNFPIRAINKLIDTINDVPGINLGTLQTFNLPRLAKGGIINMPSRGVPVGGAIAGERGMEGVIPLTDSQQMSLLGEAIGKYITINAQMNNYMDGRLISRQMEKIQSQRDFVMNGR